MYEKLRETINKIKVSTLSETRKKELEPLLFYISSNIKNQKPVRLNFICTHNSRRSHLAQIWMQTLAAYFGLKNIQSYSGGTEETTIYPTVIDTLSISGFKISALSAGKNPVYALKFAEDEVPIIGFSKIFDHFYNPENHFATVMTCTQAEEECPFILGAETRISLPYEDPKAFDNTPVENEKYYERSMQIATELFYVLSQVNTKI